MQNMLIKQDFQDAKAEVAKIYLQHYSEDELKELIAFYEKPLGKKIIKLQPVIASQSANVGMQMVQKAMDRVNIQAETARLLDEKIKHRKIDYSKMTPECRKFFGAEKAQGEDQGKSLGESQGESQRQEVNTSKPNP